MNDKKLISYNNLDTIQIEKAKSSTSISDDLPLPKQTPNLVRSLSAPSKNQGSPDCVSNIPDDTVNNLLEAMGVLQIQHNYKLSDAKIDRLKKSNPEIFTIKFPISYAEFEKHFFKYLEDNWVSHILDYFNKNNQLDLEFLDRFKQEISLKKLKVSPIFAIDRFLTDKNNNTETNNLFEFLKFKYEKQLIKYKQHQLEIQVLAKVKQQIKKANNQLKKLKLQTKIDHVCGGHVYSIKSSGESGLCKAKNENDHTAEIEINGERIRVKIEDLACESNSNPYQFNYEIDSQLHAHFFDIIQIFEKDLKTDIITGDINLIATVLSSVLGAFWLNNLEEGDIFEILNEESFIKCNYPVLLETLKQSLLYFNLNQKEICDEKIFNYTELSFLIIQHISTIETSTQKEISKISKRRIIEDTMRIFEQKSSVERVTKEQLYDIVKTLIDEEDINETFHNTRRLNTYRVIKLTRDLTMELQTLVEKQIDSFKDLPLDCTETAHRYIHYLIREGVLNLNENSPISISKGAMERISFKQELFAYKEVECIEDECTFKDLGAKVHNQILKKVEKAFNILSQTEAYNSHKDCSHLLVPTIEMIQREMFLSCSKKEIETLTMHYFPALKYILTTSYSGDYDQTDINDVLKEIKDIKATILNGYVYNNKKLKTFITSLRKKNSNQFVVLSEKHIRTFIKFLDRINNIFQQADLNEVD